MVTRRYVIGVVLLFGLSLMFFANFFCVIDLSFQWYASLYLSRMYSIGDLLVSEFVMELGVVTPLALFFAMIGYLTMGYLILRWMFPKPAPA